MRTIADFKPFLSEETRQKLRTADFIAKRLCQLCSRSVTDKYDASLKLAKKYFKGDVESTGFARRAVLEAFLEGVSAAENSRLKSEGEAALKMQAGPYELLAFAAGYQANNFTRFCEEKNANLPKIIEALDAYRIDSDNR